MFKENEKISRALLKKVYQNRLAASKVKRTYRASLGDINFSTHFNTWDSFSEGVWGLNFNIELKVEGYVKPNVRIQNDEISYFGYYFSIGDTSKQWFLIGFIDHKAKEVRPAFGYFSPHELSRFSKKVAEDLGYTFNNN